MFLIHILSWSTPVISLVICSLLGLVLKLYFLAFYRGLMWKEGVLLLIRWVTYQIWKWTVSIWGLEICVVNPAVSSDPSEFRVTISMRWYCLLCSNSTVKWYKITLMFQTPEKKQTETARGRKRKPEIQSESSQGTCHSVKQVIIILLLLIIPVK